jgi:hypothetical protein
MKTRRLTIALLIGIAGTVATAPMHASAPTGVSLQAAVPARAAVAGSDDTRPRRAESSAGALALLGMVIVCVLVARQGA